MKQHVISRINIDSILKHFYSWVGKYFNQITASIMLLMCFVFAIDMGGDFGLRNPAVAVLVPALLILNGFKISRVGLLAVPILVVWPSVLLGGALLSDDADVLIALSQFKSTIFGWVLLIILNGIVAEKILWSIFSGLTIAASLVIVLFFGVWEHLLWALTTVKYLNEFTPSLIGDTGKIMGETIVPAIYLKSTLFFLPACIYWLFKDKVFLAFICFLGLIVSCSKVGFILGVAVFIVFALKSLGYQRRLLICSALGLGVAVAYKMGYFEIISLLLSSEGVQTVQTVQTVQIRVGHFQSFIDYFVQQPMRFLFGFGLGIPMYSQGANNFVYNTELDYLNLVWRYGFIWASVFMSTILIMCFKSAFSKNKQSHIFGAVCFASFVVAGTNPVLLTPVFFVILASLVYSFKLDEKEV